MKVYIEPRTPRTPDRADGGIRRVITAMEKYLPQFGVKVTRKIEDADLTAGHVDHMPLAAGKPFVSHNHGLMWSEYFDNDSDRAVNQSVVQAMLQADAITCPSNWVKHALTYGMLRVPRVIQHGVDTSEWQVASEPGNYVLWNCYAVGDT